MRYEIGQQVWVADFRQMAPTYMTCPDCGGTGRLRVTFHDETTVSIGCRNCSSGYDEPSGKIIVYQNEASARQTSITGVEIDGDKIRWKTNYPRIVDDENIFDTQADALAYAQQRAKQYDREQRERIAHKEKDTRTWAWNASYHRGRIKQAKKNIEYHTAKLAVAAIKAKEKAAS